MTVANEAAIASDCMNFMAVVEALKRVEVEAEVEVKKKKKR